MLAWMRACDAWKAALAQLEHEHDAVRFLILYIAPKGSARVFFVILLFVLHIDLLCGLQGMLFFLASVLEYWAGAARFASLSGAEQAQCKEATWRYLAARHSALPAHVRTRFSVALARMGKHSWLTPHDAAPGFLDRLLQAAQRAETVIMALTLLKHLAEEVMGTAADLSYERREALRSALRQR